MIQFNVLNGKMAGNDWVARHFPVRIGRSPDSDLCLEEDGIWHEHVEIHLRRGEGFFLTVLGEALAAVNGNATRHILLRNGDLIEIGAVKIRFALSPARQRSLRLREFLTWLALAALCGSQVALIYWLST